MSLVFHTNRIHFGRGILGAALRAEIQRRRLKRLAILADHLAVLYGQLDQLKQILPADIDVLLLSDEGAELFDGPTIAEMCDLIALEECDTVLAIGEEHVINRAKALARDALINRIQRPTAERPTADDDGSHRPYLIAIPINASAIAAVGPTVTISAGDGERACLFDSDFAPDAVICDPDVTAASPPMKATAVGMHIVADCVEAYMARGENLPAETLALNGVQRSVAYLERAAAGRSIGQDGHVQGNLMLMSAAIEAMLAASKGFGAARAMCNAVAGAMKGVVEPGQVSAVVLPIVLDFNTTIPDAVIEGISEALRLPPGISPSLYFRQLAERLALPLSLAELGVDQQMLPHLARLAFHDHNTLTNPLVVTERDYGAMLVRAGGFARHSDYH